jgi:HrpA-like RNA helicase
MLETACVQELEKQLAEEHPPEMARVPLTTLILRIKQCRQGSPKEMLVS